MPLALVLLPSAHPAGEARWSCMGHGSARWLGGVPTGRDAQHPGKGATSPGFKLVRADAYSRLQGGIPSHSKTGPLRKIKCLALNYLC